MNSSHLMRLLALVASVAVPTAANRAFSCNSGIGPHVTERGIVKCAATACTTAIAEHVRHELDAAFDYLYLAAYFDDGKVARPGLAKFLYESSSEEREHAAMMLAYLDRRGALYSHTGYAYSPSAALLTLEKTYANVLDFALTREMEVTTRIHAVINTCENDYDAADYFTQPIIAEQHEGMRKLRGAISSFTDLAFGSQPELAEFIFDQRLLKNGL